MPPSASPHGCTSWNNSCSLWECSWADKNLFLICTWVTLPWAFKYDWVKSQIWAVGSREQKCSKLMVLWSSTELYLHRFQKHPTHFMFCSIWSEISKLNWNSWCYLGAVAEPFLRGAVLFPCTSMAGQGPGWWGNICGASCFTAGSAYSSR